MYVIYFTILTISSSSSALISWAILITFIDLIVFQSMINNELWALKKASIYINVFFESKRNDIHWELLHIDRGYDETYNRTNKKIGWYIYKYSAAFLALISLLATLFSEIYVFILEKSVYILSPVSSVIKIILSIILCILTIHINKSYFRIRGSNVGIEAELFNFIKGFYTKTRNQIDLNQEFPYQITLEKEDKTN